MAMASDPLYEEIRNPDGTQNFDLGCKPADPAIAGMVMLNFMTPVFMLGEILILSGSGREPHGRGRKPSKWWVETQECATLGEAVRLSRKVVEEADEAEKAREGGQPQSSL